MRQLLQSERLYAALFIIAQVFLPFIVLGQVDVRKYATDDLFKVTPVINQETLDEEPKPEVGPSNSRFTSQLEEGFEFWREGSLDDAVDVFDRMSETYAEVAQLYYYIGLINFERDRYGDAIEYLNETLDKDPLFLDARYLLGMIAIGQEDIKKAEEEFNLLLNVPDYVTMGYHGLGIVSLNRKKLNQAYKNFETCLEYDSSFKDAYIPMVSIDMYHGKEKRAREVIEKGLQVHKDWERGIIIRAMISLLQGEGTEQFDKDIDRLITLDSNNYHYRFMRGFLDVELGEHRRAVNNFRTAYNMEIDTLRTGEFKFNTKLDRDEAIQQALNYYKENEKMSLRLRNLIDRAACEIISGDKSLALELLEKADRIGNHPVIPTFQGVIYRSLWDKKIQALKAYSRAIELDSTHWMAYEYRGTLFYDFSKLDSAYADFSHVIKLRPRYKAGYKNRGLLLIDKGEVIKAYRDFSKGIAIDPTDYDLYFNRAIVTLRMKYYDNADGDLYAIINNKPEDFEAYYMLHTSKLNQGDTLAAIAYLDSASKFSKKANYHRELLTLARSQSLDDVSLKAHNRLVKYESWDHDHLLNRARHLYRSGKHEKALKDLRKFLKRKKRSGEAYYLLGKASQKLGRTEESEKYLQKAKRLGYDHGE